MIPESQEVISGRRRVAVQACSNVARPTNLGNPNLGSFMPSIVLPPFVRLIG
jgi:hypothetical protein